MKRTALGGVPIQRSGAVDVVAIVGVGANVAVAALGNGTAHVGVTDAVDDRRHHDPVRTSFERVLITEATLLYASQSAAQTTCSSAR